MRDWEQFLTAGVLVMVRLSGLMVFAPLFGSTAVPPRIKAGFVFAMTILLAPAVTALPGPAVELGMKSIAGELGVGLVFGLSLTMLTEALLFAGTLMGMSFSFSLVNLLDPNTHVETPVLGQMLGWLGLLVIMAAGLDRVLLAAVVRSFCVVPVGHAVAGLETTGAQTGVELARMAGGIFMAGLQLASPVMAAALAVEVTISMVSRLAPMLPVQMVGVPAKTLTSYVVLIGSLAVWPRWIERHFVALLDAAGKLLVRQHG